MIPFKKLLCPIDFSAPGDEALAAAVALARVFEAELWIVHVIVPITAMPLPTAFPEAVDVPGAQADMRASAQQALEATYANHVPLGARAQATLLEGDPADEIVRFVSEHGVDLLVMSTHGHSALERLITGSVAARVLRAAPCAVLSIRAGKAKA